MDAGYSTAAAAAASGTPGRAAGGGGGSSATSTAPVATDGTNATGRPAAASTRPVASPTAARRGGGDGRPAATYASTTIEAASGEVTTTHAHGQPPGGDASAAGRAGRSGPSRRATHGRWTVGMDRAVRRASRGSFLGGSRVSATSARGAEATMTSGTDRRRAVVRRECTRDRRGVAPGQKGERNAMTAATQATKSLGWTAKREEAQKHLFLGAGALALPLLPR